MSEASSHDEHHTVKSFSSINSHGVQHKSGDGGMNSIEESKTKSSTSFHPEIYNIIKHYDMKTAFHKSLIIICCENKSFIGAQYIIDRIINMETTIFNDLLSDYLERDEITEKQNSFRKKNVHNSKEILKEYLNRKDSFGLAPLHIASHNGQTEIIKLLISHGANPYLTTDDGLSVIHLAAEGDSVNVIHYFVKNYNINIDARDDRESTPLHWAVFEG